MNDESTRPYVRELVVGTEIVAFFLVRHRQILKKKNGEHFLKFYLGDRTGDVPAIMWSGFGHAEESLKKGSVIKVKASVMEYQNALQLIIKRIRNADEYEYDMSELVPVSECDPAESLDAIRELLDGLEDPFLRQLTDAFLSDDLFVESFKRSPAGKSLHHSYIGGLIEHTLSIMRMSQFIASHYPVINKDLLLAAAFLHDIGKVRELEYNTAFDYTTEGRLLGHIVIESDQIEEKCRAIENFPDELRFALKHIIISHHGSGEYGSPKLPMMIEALVLHYMDDMDAKVNGFNAWITNNPDPDRADWSTYWKPLERFLYCYRPKRQPEDNDAPEQS